MSYNLSRNFVLTSETSEQSQIVKAEVTVSLGHVDLLQVLKKVPDHEQYIFRIYDFRDHKYHSLSEYSIEKNFAPEKLFQRDIVLLKYVSDLTDLSHENQVNSNNNEVQIYKKERSKQRSISQVIQIVKDWRLMTQGSKNDKKINLQQAAELLKMSKKSLDDYYYQLKLGEKYGFDFRNNLNEKVGVLRAFIKNIKPKRRRGKAKLGKNYNNFRVFEQLAQIQLSKAHHNKSISGFEKEQQVKDQDVEFSTQQGKQNLSPELKKPLSHLQIQFYSEFSLNGLQARDPFLNFDQYEKPRSYIHQLLQ